MQERRLQCEQDVQINLGSQVAALLTPGIVSPPNHWPLLLPILQKSGAAGLAWKKLEAHTRDERALPLQDLYRKEALYASLHEREISRCASLFQENGVRCLFGKGWRVARCYPEWGLRACGDIDVYVASEDATRARELIGNDDDWLVSVDLHESIAEFSDETFAALWERAERLTLRSIECRFLPKEEHLCLLTLHALRHGLARPVWLLDVGFWLKESGATLRWESLTRMAPLRLSYVKGVCWLSHALFGFPFPEELLPAEVLPRWVMQEVLRAWSRPYWARLPVMSLWRDPLEMLAEIPKHWPNQIESIYEQRLHFSERAADSTMAVFVRRSKKLLPKSLRIKKRV
jgi:hypothetical protein